MGGIRRPTGGATSWLQLAATTLLFCLIPFLVYFLFYYQDRRTHLIERNVASVANVAQRIQERLAGYREVMDYALRAKYLKLRDVEAHAKSALRHSEKLAFEGIDLQRGCNTPGRLAVVATPSKQAYRLTLSLCVRRTWDEGLTKDVTLTATLDLGALTGTLDSHELFDEVAILSKDGTVLLREDRRGQRLAGFIGRMAPYSNHSPDTPGSFEGAPNAPASQIEVAGQKHWVFSQPMRLADAQGSALEASFVYGIVRDSVLRSQTLALPPVPLLVLLGLLVSVVAAWPLLRVSLMGRYDRLRAVDVRMVMVAVLCGAAVLALLVLATLEHHRMRRAIQGSLAKLADQVEGALDAELEDAVTELVAFRNRDEAWYELMEEATRSVQPDHLATTQANTAIEHAAQTGEEPPGASAESAPPSSPYTRIRTRGVPLHYPGTLIAVELDAHGTQDRKWSVKETLSPRLPVGDRKYFQDIQRNTPLCAPDDDTSICQGTGFSLENIRSRTTGAKTAILSMWRDPPAQPQHWTPKPKVIYLATHLASLWKPVLPAGMQFAIVDRAGDVLFHSDEYRSLEDNLPLDTDQPALLRDAFSLGISAEPFAVTYRGEKHWMSVRTLGNTRWSLVTMANAKHVEMVLLESVVATGLALAVLLAIGAFLRLAYLALAPRDRSPWFWPRADRTAGYWCCSALLAVLGALMGIVWTCLPGWSIELTLGGSVLTILCTWFTFRADRTWVEQPCAFLLKQLRRPDPNRTTSNHAAPGLHARSSVSLPYSVALLSVTTLLAVAPAIAIFQHMSGAYRQALLRYVHRQLHHDVVQHEQDLAEAERTIPGTRSEHFDKLRREFTRTQHAARKLENWVSAGSVAPGIYVFPPFVRKGGGLWTHTGSALLDPVWRLYDNVPPANDLAGAMRQAGLRQEDRPEIDLGTEQTEKGSGAKGPSLDGDSSDLRGPLTWAERAGATALVGALLALALLLMRQLARTLFGIGVHEIVVAQWDAAKGEYDEDARLLFYQGLRHSEEEALQQHLATKHAHLRTIDLRNPEAKLTAYPYNECVLVLHLESRLVRPELTDALLEELERLARQPGLKLVVCSEIAPIPYLYERRQDTKLLADEETPERLPDVIAWAALFADFESHPLVHVGDGETPGFLWDDEAKRERESIESIPAFAQLEETQKAKQLGYYSAARFRYLWAACTNAEKLALMDLAREATVNPRNWDVIPGLVARGLVKCRDGAFALSDPGFEEFARSAMRPEDETFMRRQHRSAWSRIGGPILAVVGIALAFFFWSQPGFTQAFLTVLSAGAAGLAGLMRLATFFAQSRALLGERSGHRA